MPQQKVTKQEFQELVKKFKAKKFAKDNDLVNELMKRFKARGDKVDLVKMRTAYLALYPDASLPPPKKKKKGKTKDKQKITTAQTEIGAEAEVVVALEPVPDASEAFEVKKTSEGDMQGIPDAVTEPALTSEDETKTEVGETSDKQAIPNAEDQSNI